MSQLYAKLMAGAVMTAALALTAPASAAEYPQITPGMSITLDRADQGNQPVYEFTPAEDCRMVVSTDYWNQVAFHSGSTIFYTSPRHELTDDGIDERVPCDGLEEGRNGWNYIYYLRGGEHYYFYVYFGTYLGLPDGTPLDGYDRYVTFTFSVEEGSVFAPHITTVFPRPDAENFYSVTNYPDLQLLFTPWGDFTCDPRTTVLEYETASGTKTTPLDHAVVSDGHYVAFKVRDALKEAARAGIVEGSVFSLVIGSPEVGGVPMEGNYVATDGNIVFRYKYRKVTTVQETIYPNPFLSYWPEDSEGGILKLVFDGDLLPLDRYAALGRQPATFNIFAGPYREPTGDDNDSGWPTLEGAPMVIEGNTLTVDLRGVVRPSADQLQALNILKETPIVSMWVQNLLDASGAAIDFEIGSYNGALVQINDIPFVLYEKIVPTYEYTPASTPAFTASLSKVNSVELWLDEITAERISITGFEYLQDGKAIATIPVADTDPFEDAGMVYTIPVPANVKNAAGEITLSAVCSSYDGYTYEISAVYFNEAPAVTPTDTFESEFTRLEPVKDMVASVGQVAVTWETREITLCEGAHAEWYLQTDLFAAPDDLGELKDGNLRVHVYNCTPPEGGVPDFSNADAPARADEAEPMNGLQVEMPFDAFWTKGQYNIVIPEGTVMDAEGKVNPRTILTFWALEAFNGVVEVSPATENFGNAATVETLDNIVISFNGAFNVELNMPAGITLRTETGEDLILDDIAEPVYDESNGDITALSFDVSNFTATPGVYELIFGEDAFIVDYAYVNGTEFSGRYNVTVGGQTPDPELPEAPAPKIILPINAETELFYGGVSVVWGYNTLRYTGESTACAITWPDGTTTVKNGKISDANSKEIEIPDPEAENKPIYDNSLLFINVNLDFDTGYIQMPGKWSVEIPAGIVEIDVNSVDPDLGTETESLWVPNSAVTLTWKVLGEGGTSSVELVGVDAETVYYDLQGNRVANPDKGVYIKVTGTKAEKVILTK